MFTRDYIEQTEGYKLFRSYVLLQAQLLGVAMVAADMPRKAVSKAIIALYDDSNEGDVS